MWVIDGPLKPKGLLNSANQPVVVPHTKQPITPLLSSLKGLNTLTEHECARIGARH